jgi:putative SOS response-associated peptidase YedK
MCGRDSANYTWAEVKAFSEALVLNLPDQNPEPIYNRAPTHLAWGLIPDAKQISAAQMRWSLFAGSQAPASLKTFNARLETVRSKATFKRAFAQGRCLVPASGYFEWAIMQGQRQAYYLHAEHHPLLMFAAIQTLNPELGIPSYAILTRDADPEIAHLHARMPVMLQPAYLESWLFGSEQDAESLAASCQMPKLRLDPVAAAVGNVAYQSPDVRDRVALEAPRQGQLF